MLKVDFQIGAILPWKSDFQREFRDEPISPPNDFLIRRSGVRVTPGAL
jgi:hypothetical protein